MELLTAATDGWKDIGTAPDAAATLQRQLTDVLLAERLVVLTGLGTSRCLSDPAGGLAAPTMADLWSRAKELAADRFEELLAKAGWLEGSAEDIELLLSRCQMALELRDDDELRTFVNAAEQAIAKACRFVTEDIDLAVHETFLRRVARRPTRLPRTQLYTTNYDLAFEAAASRTGFALVDGFSHAHPQRFDASYFDQDFAVRDRERSAVAVEWIPNVLQLHKLHGSVDWYAMNNGDVRRDPTQERPPLIIYPRSTKFELSYQQPFFELMARFQAALRRPETGLLVMGSGLRDNHITEPIMSAVRSNTRFAAVFVAPGIRESTNDHLRKVEEMISRGDHRLALLAASFEEAVYRLPNLVATTEAERHEARAAPDE